MIVAYIIVTLLVVLVWALSWKEGERAGYEKGYQDARNGKPRREVYENTGKLIREWSLFPKADMTTTP